MAVEPIEGRAGEKGTAHNGPPVLWHLKVSHYNEKVRWALDYKGVPHVRRASTPGRHRAQAKRLAGGSTFPVLVLGGEAIGDSTRIIAALEREYPDPPLYPQDPEARRRALGLEEFFDEELGPYTRLLVVNATLRSPRLFLGTFTPDLPAWRHLAARAMFPLIRRQVLGQFRISETSVEHAAAKVDAAAERFRAELGPDGYLVGERFTVADLTLAALVAPAVAPRQFPYPQPQRDHPLLEDVRLALDRAGLADWASEIYARHRGRSTEVAPA